MGAPITAAGEFKIHAALCFHVLGDPPLVHARGEDVTFCYILHVTAQVHARAFKLLTKLAGTVLDDEVLMYRLYLEYDPARSGTLGLTELSKCVVPSIVPMHVPSLRHLPILSKPLPHTYLCSLSCMILCKTKLFGCYPHFLHPSPASDS